jgi:hypothetical protein
MEDREFPVEPENDFGGRVDAQSLLEFLATDADGDPAAGEIFFAPVGSCAPRRRVPV